MRHFLLIISFYFSTGLLCAQSLEAGRGEDGVIVYYHGPLPLSEGAQIVRTDQSGKTKSFKLVQSGSEIDVLRNGQNISAVHKYLLPFGKEAAIHVWKILKSAKNTADIEMYNLPSVAFSCGLALRDSSAKENINYTYQLKVNGQNVGNEVSVNNNSNSKLLAPLALGSSTAEASAKLGWYIPQETRGNILGFISYRSQPLAEKYSPLITLQGFQNQTDSLIAIVRDTTTHLVGSWNYMIRLVDRFGAVGPPSQPIMAHNYPPESLPTIRKFQAKGDSKLPVVNLSWKLHNAFRVSSLKLYRSRFPDKDYVLVKELSPADSVATDYILDVMEAYFYFLEIEDLGGEKNLRSVITPAVSEYKPESFPVAEVTAEPKEKGILVTWRGHIPNDRGYYVLRMEGFSDSLKTISGFIPASTDTAVYSYFDKDQTLRGDRHYTYGVVSESHGYLKSDVEVTASARPNIPLHVPVPQTLSLRQHDDESGFSLTWRHVASEEYNNLFGYRIFYRKNANANFIEFTKQLILADTNWIELPPFLPETEWAVKAYDIFGNESVLSKPVQFNDPFYLEFGPRYLRADLLEDLVEIRWNNTAPHRIAKFELYRSTDDKEPQLLKTFNADELNFQTQYPDEESIHYYYLVAIDKNNAVSKASESIMITR